MSKLHLLLLAYYRVLVACPFLPATFQWSPEPLSQLLSISGLDMGARWLAVRCYALHTRMSEAQRDELQLSHLGPAGETDVPVQSGRALDGEIQWLDGWLLPTIEVMRIRNARQAMLDEDDFYDGDELALSSRIDIDKLRHV